MWGAPIFYLFIYLFYLFIILFFVMGIFDITNFKNKNKIGQSQNRCVVTSVG